MVAATVALSVALTSMGAAPDCPAEVLVSESEICYQTGGVETPENTVSALYSVATPFGDGSEICVKLDLTAELEAGGYDQVFLHWDDGLGVPVSDCLVGDSPGDCTTIIGGGCTTLPTVVWDLQGTYCFEPSVGATDITVSVYVQPTDLLYNCGDCPPGGDPRVMVHSLEVTGCTGTVVSGCGDGVLDAGEGCDDGNTLAQDGCSQSCQLEAGGICNEAGSACVGGGTCDPLVPSDLSEAWCYATADDKTTSPLSYFWQLGPSPGPVDLHWDLEGGVELQLTPFDVWMLTWEDDQGAYGDIVLNAGTEIGTTKTQAWSKGSARIVPSATATTLSVTVWVDTDGATSCSEPKVDQTYEPLTVNSLHLSSCGVEMAIYDTLAEFSDAVGDCYLLYDFNAYADGDAQPFVGDGFVVQSDSNMPGVECKVSTPTHWYSLTWGEGYGYWSTQASGDGTAALEPQPKGNFVSNSRLAIDFFPKPRKAIALNLIDGGDWGGVLAIEAWKDGELVYVNNDPGATGSVNNYIVWKGFVFSEPVDRVVFFQVKPSDHFAVDNVIVIPQDDADADTVPDLCDCQPDNENVAGGFPEACDDGIDNNCDGLTDGEAPECGGSGTTACGDYANVSFASNNGGWLSSGDQAWAWDSGSGVWSAAGAANLDSVLETAPITIPANACPDFVVQVDLSGATEAPGDTLTILYAVNGGAYQELDQLFGALATKSYSLPVLAGETVTFRFHFVTDASGIAGTDPVVGGLSITSDSGDGDNDGVCDACDCAPSSASYGFVCDGDGDGWCADDTGPLNSDPSVAGCDEDTSGGGSVEGTDCDDNAAGANPGNAIEATNQCSDGLDNDCDGLTDTEDVEDCPVEDCTDDDGDGYGTGTTCTGPDCNDDYASCTTDCSDADNDGLPDCADDCIDADGDGYGIGDGCAGGAVDCNDAIDSCTTDCTSDADGNGVPDCQQDEVCGDKDGDGYGNGPDCAGPDCDDTAASCIDDCETDDDGDGIPDCKDGCVDADQDGYGVGPDCAGEDCSDQAGDCHDDCSADIDNDGKPDCGGDDCIDVDGDGYGVGPGCDGEDCADDASDCTTDCATDADGDSIPDCQDDCVDVDGDGYGEGDGCVGADCHDNAADCTDDCSDTDGDGTPDCITGCVDVDGDGYGLGPTCTDDDCDDSAATCTTDCSDEDGDTIPDCADDCLDPDGDGFGAGSGCKGSDCTEQFPECAADCTDSDGDLVPDCVDDCTDADGDGYGIGDGCTDTDCDDTEAACTLECIDSNLDGVFDCADPQVDPEMGTDVPSQQEGCACSTGESRVPWELGLVLLFLVMQLRRARRFEAGRR